MNSCPHTHPMWSSLLKSLKLLTGAFATVDGLNLHVEHSSDPEVENATYNGWLHEHFIKNVFVFAPTGIFFF
jgi:hypothetical protein